LGILKAWLLAAKKAWGFLCFIKGDKMKKRLYLLSICLLAAGSVKASIVYNGDFSTEVLQDTSTASTIAGNEAYSLDGSGNVTNVTAGGITDSDTNQWFISKLTSLPTWGADAGSGGIGDGALVQVPLDNVNNKPRGIIQFAHDGKATTGAVGIAIDFKFNLTDTGMFGNIELYAWNEGDVAPTFSQGGATADSAVYNVTDAGNAVNLLGETGVQIAASGFSADTWKTVKVTNSLDLGSGYDYYAWRIGLVGADGPNDTATYDNLSIIPATDSIAVINTSVTSGDIPLEVDFDGSDSFSSGTITDYAWDFGDGNTANGMLASHIYTEANVYTVWLTVTDELGNVFSNSVDIIAEYQTLVAEATATPSDGSAPLEVVFDGSGSVVSTGGSITNFAWNFGDGNSDFGVVVTNTYVTDGVYTGSLVVADSNGNIDTNTIVIVVNPETSLDISSQASGTTDSDPFPATFIPISTNDLANSGQSTFLSIIGTDLQGDTVATDLNNGAVPSVANDGSDRAAIINASTVTINFDTSVNTEGYDITGINTYAGWDPVGEGRANQDYTVTVTFMDDSTATLYIATASEDTGLEPNLVPNSWTAVYLTDSTGTMASGVKAITFSSFDDYRGSGAQTVQYREIDVFGTATTATTLGDVTFGVISGSQVVLSWEAVGTCDVWTNANLVYPNWGVMASGVSSPVTNAIGSEALLFYELRK
jgi:PKD repeat protein